MALHYMGDSVLVTDDVCGALLRYARALAETQASDVITVPIVASTGESISAEFLLGPASQLYATHATDGVDEQTHADVVAELDRRSRALHPTAVSEHLSGRRPPEFTQDFE
ncbi:hypothetical protein [Microbacterium deminutum]